MYSVHIFLNIKESTVTNKRGLLAIISNPFFQSISITYLYFASSWHGTAEDVFLGGLLFKIMSLETLQQLQHIII